MALKRFIVKILGVSIVLTLTGWLVFSLFIPQYYLPVFPWLLLFFLVFTVIVHAYQLKLAKKDIARFARSNMLATFFKLVVYSLFAIVYIANDPQNALIFVIGLMIVYVVFTFIEVAEITRVSKNKKAG